jgi:hypothetical protein
MQQQMHDAMQQIPDDIARTAHEQQLGTPQARYLITVLRRGWRWPRVILPFVSLAFLLVFIVFFAIIALFLNNIPLNIFLFSFISLLGVSYVAIIACAIAVRFTHKVCNIYPCDGGLILKQSITKFRVIRWEEIETIWHTLQGDRLVIYDITQRKPWYKLKARHIPNLFLLFALADYARTLPE